jgi:translation initiation factor 1A
MVIKKGGKKNKKKKTGGNNDGYERELIFKDAEGQEYGQILRLLGNCRMECNCFDGVTRLVHIRGKIRKKDWIIVGDVVLLSLRDFEDSKADVLMKYNTKEVRRLKNLGEIPEDVKINEGDIEDEDKVDIGFDFEETIDKEDGEEEEKNKIENIEDIFDSI